jgi:ATP-dependent Lon protease
VAKEIVLGTASPPFRIEPERLVDYLGQPVYPEEVIKRAVKPGMAIGLAWTNFAAIPSSSRRFRIRGKETSSSPVRWARSCRNPPTIAYSYVRHIAPNFGIQKEFFEETVIHLHIPEGATPKDGPSAGITMATALLSLARGKKSGRISP